MALDSTYLDRLLKMIPLSFEQSLWYFLRKVVKIRSIYVPVRVLSIFTLTLEFDLFLSFWNHHIVYRSASLVQWYFSLPSGHASYRHWSFSQAVIITINSACWIPSFLQTKITSLHMWCVLIVSSRWSKADAHNWTCFICSLHEKLCLFLTFRSHL
jgi:hypothetical protein